MHYLFPKLALKRRAENIMVNTLGFYNLHLHREETTFEVNPVYC